MVDESIIYQLKEKGHNVITYQPNFQERFVRSNVDFCIGGSAMGVGKSYAALLMAAEPSLDSDFRMVYIRRNIGDLKSGGSGTDEVSKIYKNCGNLKLSENPRFTFNNKSFIDFTHMADQSPDKVLERIRGWQYSCVYIDEGTGFNWSTIKLIFSRNRGGGKWTGKLRLTCNPKKTHWLRKWCQWYIDPTTGFPIPERDGIVRYFYINGESIDDVVFGDSKKEVYEKCRVQIDAILKKMNSTGDNYTYDNIVKSTTFYSGKLSDNKELLKKNPGYIGSVAAMGEKNSMANLQGCWNVDPEDDSQAEIPQHIAREIENADPQTNGDYWITADLADKGTDNFVALAWNGFHIIDILILPKTTPRRNALELKKLAEQYDIADSHIIFDGNNALYINDYIPDAIGFISYNKPYGKYSLNVTSLKDACYMRLVYMIKHQLISFSNEVLKRRYYHSVMKDEINVLTEFVEECSVIAFKEVNSGKKKLLNKKEMNTLLGKGRSMDLLDPIAMRLYPVLNYDYGDERLGTMVEREEAPLNIQTEIFNDDFWA